MAVSIPVVTLGGDVTEVWADAVAAAVAEVQQLALMDEAAVPITAAGWANYGGGYPNLQVRRFGPLVIMVGMIRNNTGVAVAPPTAQLALVPVGFRPRAIGSGAPLGGGLLVGCPMSSPSPGTGRVQVGSDGALSVGATSGSGSIVSGGWVSCQLVWSV